MKLNPVDPNTYRHLVCGAQCLTNSGLGHTQQVKLIWVSNRCFNCGSQEMWEEGYGFASPREHLVEVLRDWIQNSGYCSETYVERRTVAKVLTSCSSYCFHKSKAGDDKELFLPKKCSVCREHMGFSYRGFGARIGKNMAVFNKLCELVVKEFDDAVQARKDKEEAERIERQQEAALAASLKAKAPEPPPTAVIASWSAGVNHVEEGDDEIQEIEQDTWEDHPHFNVYHAVCSPECAEAYIDDNVGEGDDRMAVFFSGQPLNCIACNNSLAAFGDAGYGFERNTFQVVKDAGCYTTKKELTIDDLKRYMVCGADCHRMLKGRNVTIFDMPIQCIHDTSTKAVDACRSCGKNLQESSRRNYGCNLTRDQNAAIHKFINEYVIWLEDEDDCEDIFESLLDSKLFSRFVCERFNIETNEEQETPMATDKNATTTEVGIVNKAKELGKEAIDASKEDAEFVLTYGAARQVLGVFQDMAVAAAGGKPDVVEFLNSPIGKMMIGALVSQTPRVLPEILTWDGSDELFRATRRLAYLDAVEGPATALRQALQGHVTRYASDLASIRKIKVRPAE